MKKMGSVLYIVLCLLISMLPLIGMSVAATHTTTENRRLAEKPVLTKNGGWNKNYFQEWGAWFEDHFALRTAYVTADSVILSRIFGISGMKTVIVGSEGWLYYASTLGDYTGSTTLSQRGIWNVVHNLSVIEDRVEESGARFLFTVAPNKNSLYGEHMPYYYRRKCSSIKNMDLLTPALDEYKIPYANLFTEFEKQKEVLYLKRDSHWNGKGAVLTYNTLLDALQIDHDNFETVDSVRSKDEYGDLNRMLYPMLIEPEWNYTYQIGTCYQYVTNTQSVEDVWIETENVTAEGSLLMFRDSFGNTLLPLLADTFKNAYFSKSVPYRMEEYLQLYHPDYVIVEKVERNVDDFAVDPPIMKGPERNLYDSVEREVEKKEVTSGKLEVSESEYAPDYWQIRGVLKQTDRVDTKVYICVIQDGQSRTYEAFTVSDAESDYGYVLYLAKADMPSGIVQIGVITETNESWCVAEKKILDMDRLQELDEKTEE
ncbi:MAG: hypothetical protein IJ801_06690 [Lachnospiraceae bacterium]|nr:hypothetical protein [Lachnospiraceae bacterium]